MKSSKIGAMIGLGAIILALGLSNFLGEETEAESAAGAAVYAPGRQYSTGVGANPRIRAQASSGGRRQAKGTSTERRSGACSDASFAGGEAQDISVQVRFNAAPAIVRKAITKYVESCYPQALPYMKWDAAGTTVSASNLGASCTIILSGTGPTLVEINGDIGLPASLFVSEKLVRVGLNQAIRDIKKKTS